MIRMNFKYDVKETEHLIKEKVLLVQKKIAMQMLEGVVNMTPVDTGRARGNWMTSVRAPNLSSDVNRYDKGGGQTIQAGMSAIQSLQDFGTIYLTNNLPYIVALEKGHSRQAPVGMVRVSLDRVAMQFGKR